MKRKKAGKVQTNGLTRRDCGTASQIPTSRSLARPELIGLGIKDTRNNRSYVVEDEVLTGGMGIVLQCSRGKESPIILKACREEKHLNLFYKEANNWLKLSAHPHPNIVTAEDLFEYDLPGIGKRYFLVLELVAGPRDIQDILNDAGMRSITARLNNDFRAHIGRFSTETVLRCLLDICAGMEHIGRAGITAHGDLKPENILIDHAERAKITDFGLSGMDTEGFHSGVYTAPELRHGGKPTVQSDVYSFGRILRQDIIPSIGDIKTRQELKHIANKCQQNTPTNRFLDFAGISVKINCLYKAIYGKDYEPLPLFTPTTEILIKTVAGLNSLPLPEYETMQNILSEAEELSNNNPTIYSWLGQTYYMQGKLEQSWTAYKKAAELNPHNTANQNNLGLIRFRQNRLDEAVGIFNQIIQLGLADDFTYHHLGEILRKQNKPAEAISAFNQAIKLAPDNPDNYCKLSFIYDAQGKLSDAISFCRKAVDLASDNPSRYARLPISLYNDLLNNLSKKAHAIEKTKAVHRQMLDSDNPEQLHFFAISIHNRLDAKELLEKALGILTAKCNLSNDEYQLKTKIANALRDLRI